MCNLYRLDSKAKAIADIFGAEPGNDPWDGDYVAPGRFAPVVVQERHGRRIVPRLWGVPPPPKIAQADAAAGRTARGVTNVRNLDSPFWIGTLRHTEYRCLVPVTSFMEWGGIKGARTQHWFALLAEPIFAFAGIWRDSEVPSFAFLTCEPNSIVGTAHPKAMPVILAAYDWDRWLSEPWPSAVSMIEPYPSQLMKTALGKPPG